MNLLLRPLLISFLIAAPYHVARGESAKVIGSIACSGVAVGLSIDIEGEIDARTAEDVRRLFDQYHERQAKLKAGSVKCDMRENTAAFGTRYGINSLGGSVAAAMEIGRTFRRERAWLGVAGPGPFRGDGVCMSACVLILAGAVDRYIGKSGRVGIHRPYLATTPEHPLTGDQVKNAYRAMLQDMRAYLREMNVSERLADDMLATEPERVHILTPTELEAYGLAGVDPGEQQRRAIEKEARDVQEANQLGLDRREYTRRKMLGETLCLYTKAGEPVTDYFEFWKCKQGILKTGQR